MEPNVEEIKHYLKLSIESIRKMQEQSAAYNNPDDKWFDGRCNGQISAYQDVLRRIGANDG